MGYFCHLSTRTRAHLPSIRSTVNVVVTAGLGYALYRQFFVVNDVVALWGGFRQNLHPRWLLLGSLIAGLMPVNLALEARKLRVALPQNLRSPWRETLGQVCAGIAVGLWTPGRVGEFAGRLARTNSTQRTAILASTALGGLAQWVPLLAGGGFALLYWDYTSLAQDGSPSYIAKFSPNWLASAGVVGLVIASATGVLFWRLASILALLTRLRPPTWLRSVAGRLSWPQWRSAATLRNFVCYRRALIAAAVTRYVVYLLQMSLAFVTMGLPLDLRDALVGTAALLLLHGFLPVPPALQAMARIEFAVVLFAAIRPNEVSIAAASLLIFALNLGLPALYGWLFIVRSNDKTLPQ